MALPVEAVLPELKAALSERRNAVLVAPPGAGKTTMIAPALLHEDWCQGTILLLSPRRIAARAAAERMAELAGEAVGQSIGYQTRMDSRVSGQSRIIVMTGGIFINRIQGDPELSGISAVLFDEVHERSIDSDFGLALALEAQAAFRPDLRLVAMSATLDGARFARLMGDADPTPVLENKGTAHPLALRHVGRRSELRIEDDMVSVIQRALRDDQGDVLAFLPGVGEIDRVAERLSGRSEQIAVLKLHGSLLPGEQRQSLRPDPDGRRKVILASSIAETSLTIDGVRIVVDSGLARRPRFDQAAGVARLVTERVSAAGAIQRAGRAARQGPGIAYRLWEEAATGGLLPFEPPEILESDLSSLVLHCAAWGESDPMRLHWLDPPLASGLDAARRALKLLGALDDQGRITAHGETLAKLAMPPHVANMLLHGAARGQAETAAQIALLLQERGLGGVSEDLETRLTRWAQDRSARADAARRTASAWVKRAAALVPKQQHVAPLGYGLLLSFAYPDRIARRKDDRGESWQSAGGRSYRLDSGSALSGAQWLAVGEVQGSAAQARILSAMRLDADAIEGALANRIETRAELRFVAEAGRVEARLEKRLGSILLSSGPDPNPDQAAVSQMLVDIVRRDGLDILPWGEKAKALRTRAAFAGLDMLSDAALLATLDEWLTPLLGTVRSFGSLPSGVLHGALEGLLGWEGQRQVERLAPAEFRSPAGTSHMIDYGALAGPTVELRVQALFGLSVHPVVGEGRVPLILSLTSPAGRPIQTTRDLPAFWAGSWRDVAKDMRGRYPKHHWPDDPAAALPSLKTKKAQARHGNA